MSLTGKYGYVDDAGKVREIEYGASRRGFEPAGKWFVDKNLSNSLLNNAKFQEAILMSHLQLWIMITIFHRLDQTKSMMANIEKILAFIIKMINTIPNQLRPTATSNPDSNRTQSKIPSQLFNVQKIIININLRHSSHNRVYRHNSSNHNTSLRIHSHNHSNKHSTNNKHLNQDNTNSINNSHNLISHRPKRIYSKDTQRPNSISTLGLTVFRTRDRVYLNNGKVLNVF